MELQLPPELAAAVDHQDWPRSLDVEFFLREAPPSLVAHWQNYVKEKRKTEPAKRVAEGCTEIFATKERIAQQTRDILCYVDERFGIYDNLKDRESVEEELNSCRSIHGFKNNISRHLIEEPVLEPEGFFYLSRPPDLQRTFGYGVKFGPITRSSEVWASYVYFLSTKEIDSRSTMRIDRLKSFGHRFPLWHPMFESLAKFLEAVQRAGAK